MSRWLSILMLVGLVAVRAVLAAASADSVVGTYALRGVMETASELVLRADGRFELGLTYGAADYWSRGTWTREGAEVVLNTDVPPREPVRLTASKAAAGPGVRVHLVLLNGRPLPNVEIRLTSAAGTSEARTDSHGAASFPNAARPTTMQVDVAVFDFSSRPLALDSRAGEFTVALDGEQISLLRFTHTKAAADGSALVLQLPNARKPFRYVKVIRPGQ